VERHCRILKIHGVDLIWRLFLVAGGSGA